MDGADECPVVPPPPPPPLPPCLTLAPFPPLFNDLDVELFCAARRNAQWHGATSSFSSLSTTTTTTTKTTTFQPGDVMLNARAPGDASSDTTTLTLVDGVLPEDHAGMGGQDWHARRRDGGGKIIELDDATMPAAAPKYYNPDNNNNKEATATQSSTVTSESVFEDRRRQHGQPPPPPLSLSLSPSDHPSNWPARHRHLLTAHLSLSSLLSLSCASAPSPLLHQLSDQLSNSNSNSSSNPPSAETTLLLILSIYFLALALSPLILAPLSEHPRIGRRPIVLSSLALFTLANALTPIQTRPTLSDDDDGDGDAGQGVGGGAPGKPSLALILTMRFFAGCGAATPIVLSGPVMRDLYPNPEQRGRALSLVGGAVYLGPAVGPILGGVVGKVLGWRWVFWLMSLAGLLLLGWGLWAVRESFPTVVAKVDENEVGKMDVEIESGITRQAAAAATGLAGAATSLVRPFRIFAHRPVLQVVSLLNGLGFGIYTIVLSTFATLWIEAYHQSEATASLHYIAIALGASIACQGSGRLMDAMHRRLKARYAGQTTDKQAPEFRIPMLALSVLILPVGLICYGWAAERRVHWLVVDLAVALWCIGTFANAQTLLAYTLDEFAEHAASASAASKFWGYIAGFLFPLFAPGLYTSLGYGVGNTVLAVAFIILAWPAPFLMWTYGPELRALRWWSSKEKEHLLSNSTGLHHKAQV